MNLSLRLSICTVVLFLATPVGIAAKDSFLLRVAARCAGEAGWIEGVHLCSCTVQNRLQHGWAESDVLTAYYANDAQPTDAMISATKKGLENHDCPANAYFLFEVYSVQKLNLNVAACSTGVTIHPNDTSKIVWTFPYETFKLKKCFK